MCECGGDGKVVAACAGCGATSEPVETFLEMYDQIQTAGWGQTICGKLLCASCVERVAKRAAMIANAHLN